MAEKKRTKLGVMMNFSVSDQSPCANLRTVSLPLMSDQNASLVLFSSYRYVRFVTFRAAGSFYVTKTDDTLT